MRIAEWFGISEETEHAKAQGAEDARVALAEQRAEQKRKREEAEAKALTPRPMNPHLNGGELAEYTKVATALGLEASPALLGQRLCAVLKEENISAFDGAAVIKYLDRQLGSHRNGNWCWRAVREQDFQPYGGGWAFDHVDMERGPYAKAIPLPVLLTMQKIAAKLPETCFFISDQSAPKGDPFLMVAAGPRTGYFIVERWDEPGFRDRQEAK